jgi:hypothetical protein
LAGFIAKTFAKSAIYVYDARHSAAVPVTADPPGGVTPPADVEASPPGPELDKRVGRVQESI